MATCPYCATEMDDGARFCGVCGRPITPTAADQHAAAADRVGAPASGRSRRRPRRHPRSSSRRPSRRIRRADSGAAPLPTRRGRRLRRRPRGQGRCQRRIRGPQQPLENLIGRTLNHRYLVEDKIGEGGFGAVFRGKQIATGREVALKILHPHNVSDETIVARFRREAEACSKLRDPHTVTTYDFDETPDGILYLAMELLRGRSLHQLQKAEGPLTPARVLRILDQVRRRWPRPTPTASSTAT